MHFNVGGPCLPELHYMLPAGPRLPGGRERAERGQYFVVHDPRQKTGKTTSLMDLARDLTAAGEHVALVVSCEVAKTAGDDIGAAGRAILDRVAAAARRERLSPDLMPPQPWPDARPETVVSAGLEAWAQACPLPLVLLFDEVDALRGKSLLSFLAQVRDGFTARPLAFPKSVALCGLRDIRDYRVASGRDPEVIGSTSPFNVSVKSYRLADFTPGQVAELYGQHTAATGQEFTAGATELAFEYTQGQPWLVNALAAEITQEMGITPPEPVTAAHIEQAKERLILARATHLDSLTARLGEPRVQRVIEPILAGTQPARDLRYNDDLAYVRDLGLIASDDPVRVANPIYREVIVRVLTSGIQADITAEPRAFLLPDGRLDFGKILHEFAAWWKLNGEFLARGEVYHEVAPQLIFMAYLQRIVNSGGFVDREYGIGTGRTDILVRKPCTGPDGKPAVQAEAIELKLRTAKTGDPLPGALTQLDGYLARCGLDAGYLLIFDRRPAAVRQEINPRFSEETTASGRAVTVLQA